MRKPSKPFLTPNGITVKFRPHRGAPWKELGWAPTMGDALQYVAGKGMFWLDDRTTAPTAEPKGLFDAAPVADGAGVLV